MSNSTRRRTHIATALAFFVVACAQAAPPAPAEGGFTLVTFMGVIMKNLVRVLCLVLFGCAHAQSLPVAIRGVTVVDVRDGSLHPEQTVLVAGNRIAAVGSVREVAVPDDAKVVEAAGQYLIPGLWDMHVHSVANVALDRSLGSVAAQDWHFPLFLAHGVTGVRNMNDGTGDVTLALTKTVRRQLAEGVLRGPPRFLTAGPSLDGDPPLGSNPVVVRTAAEARAAVEKLVSNGADLVKVYENLSREAYFAIMDEARRRRIPVDGHVPFRITPEEVADAGQRTVEHPDALAAGCSTAAEAERKRFASVLADYDSLPDDEKFLAMFRHARALYDSRDPVACASVIEAYRRNGVAVTVDLVAYHHVVYAKQVLSDATRMRFVPQEIRRNWENWLDSETTREFQSILRPIVPLELENVRLLNEAGVLLLAGRTLGCRCKFPASACTWSSRGWSRLASLLSRPCRPPLSIPHASWRWSIPWAASGPASSPIWCCSRPIRSRTSATRRGFAQSSPTAGSIAGPTSTSFLLGSNEHATQRLPETVSHPSSFMPPILTTAR